ncbi:CoA synthetase [Aliidongia dinghuensis]|uniref:CoA synthetase n=1 Tax=Aliidongia dinghuensis TaxID=1867774 RepID=A0A8J3E496_9PROT|nr:CoA transferase [Aliidongia dinghuensis]GGF25434.1 CoA synthetase [Aliidongia dinghuensis]
MTAGHPTDLDAALRLVEDGALVAIPPDYAGVAMAATRALIRRGIRNLRLVCVPQSGLQADLLIGAGVVAEIETAAVTLGEYGLAPRFTAAIREQRIRIKDATCPAIHAGLQASEKGAPFTAMRGLIGSDLIKVRPDWRVIDNPFGSGDDPVALIPAIRPDVALFHAPMADRNGNVWVGKRRELVTMAHASATSVVTVERLYDGDLLADDTLAAGTLPALYVGRVAIVPEGTRPIRFGARPNDGPHLAEYAELAATDAGFATYLARELAR